jgi:hypothetical protein
LRRCVNEVGVVWKQGLEITTGRYKNAEKDAELRYKSLLSEKAILHKLTRELSTAN